MNTKLFTPYFRHENLKGKIKPDSTLSGVCFMKVIQIPSSTFIKKIVKSRECDRARDQ